MKLQKLFAEIRPNSPEYDDAGAKLLSRGVMDAIVSEPFWGSLILQLERVQVADGTFIPFPQWREEVQDDGTVQQMLTVVGIPLAMATDGQYLYYTPGFCKYLAKKDGIGAITFVVVHEVAHIVLKHILRRGARDPYVWGLATDYAVNAFVKASTRGGQGIHTMPDLVLYRDDFAGLSAEVIYSMLQQEQEQERKDNKGDKGKDQKSGQKGDKGDKGEGQEPGDGDGDGEDGENQSDAGGGPKHDPDTDVWGNQTGRPSQCGGLLNPISEETGKPLTPGEQQAMEGLINQAIQSAARAAKSQGNLPGSIAELVDSLKPSQVSWVHALQLMLEEIARDDYSWTRPNRKHLVRDIVLPSLYNQQARPMVFAIDTSGSVTSNELTQHVGELAEILRTVNVSSITVVQCDMRVVAADTYDRDNVVFELGIKGRGGTMFTPVFEWVEENMEDQPSIMVYATDLECNDFPEPPDYPVLWLNATPDGNPRGTTPPFGHVLTIKITG